jgi:hypothetical protein
LEKNGAKIQALEKQDAKFSKAGKNRSASFPSLGRHFGVVKMESQNAGAEDQFSPYHAGCDGNFIRRWPEPGKVQFASPLRRAAQIPDGCWRIR